MILGDVIVQTFRAATYLDQRSQSLKGPAPNTSTLRKSADLPSTFLNGPFRLGMIVVTSVAWPLDEHSDYFILRNNVPIICHSILRLRGLRT